MNYEEIEKQQIHRLQIYCEQHVKLGDIVADRSTVLVFIAKEGEPYATAELVRHGRKYKLGQFYGDENDRNDCLAKDDAMSALDQWAKKFKVRMAA